MMGEIIEFKQDAHCCARCRIPMTTATAEGREDGLYCDTCLEFLIDNDGADLARERETETGPPS